MAEPLTGGELLDSALAAVLGPVDDATAEAIAGICNDALRDVLGPVLAGQLLMDRRRLPLAAMWVWDLARGLQFQSREGAAEPATADLLALLGGLGLAGLNCRRLAEQIDIAAVLTLDRVVAQVLGPGATARDPRINEDAAPWLTGLKLGTRIHLVQETLRLLPPTSA
jgi:hypothetical protein